MPRGRKKNTLLVTEKEIAAATQNGKHESRVTVKLLEEAQKAGHLPILRVLRYGADHQQWVFWNVIYYGRSEALELVRFEDSQLDRPTRYAALIEDVRIFDRSSPLS